MRSAKSLREATMRSAMLHRILTSRYASRSAFARNYGLCACALKRTGLSRRHTTTHDHTRPRTTTRWSCAVVRGQSCVVGRAWSGVRGRVYLSLSLHRYMFICPYHSTDTCLFVRITPQIHVYLSLSLHRYMFICPYHSMWSAVAQLVECRTRNRESPGSNPRCYRFEVWAFSFTSRRLSRLSCINEYLAIDSGGNVSE